MEVTGIVALAELLLGVAVVVLVLILLLVAHVRGRRKTLLEGVVFTVVITGKNPSQEVGLALVDQLQRRGASIKATPMGADDPSGWRLTLLSVTMTRGEGVAPIGPSGETFWFPTTDIVAKWRAVSNTGVVITDEEVYSHSLLAPESPWPRVADHITSRLTRKVRRAVQQRSAPHLSAVRA